MGAPLASQPTLSCFENAVGPWALARMGRTLAATVTRIIGAKSLWRHFLHRLVTEGGAWN